MELRPLGSTGLLVSPLGLGTVKIGRNRGVKYPVEPGRAPGAEAYPLPSDEGALTLLRTAAELGVNLLDTAPAYGLAEERLGSLLSRERWLGGRDRWVLCTKAGEEFDPATGQSRFDFSPAHVKASVERSLRRLRTDVLDVVLLHSDGRDDWVLARSGALPALRELQRRGHVRAVGVSTKTVDGGLLALRDGTACDVVMLTYNPRDRAEGVVIDAARLRGAGVLVKKGLASGHVADLMARMPPEIRDCTADPVEASLRFALGKPGVSSLIVGTSNPDHLWTNVRTAETVLADV
jgi:aryl-alcohol dehydrogenase-like predicted oxidoreductase